MRAETQTGAIRELSKAGFGPSRIALLLGTMARTVTSTVAKPKKRAAKADEKKEN